MLGAFKNQGQANATNAAQSFAKWAGVLCTLLITPQIWQVSGWLSDKVLVAQFGYDLAYYLTFAVFALICLMAVSMSRIAWGTSIGMLLIFVIAKLPII
ncbi:MAG: hypothetical protein AAGA09_03170 [Pseudomonadota bacterium]